MKRGILLITTILIAVSASTIAQETIIIPDTLDNEWATTWVAGINGSQAAYKNWSAGGQNNVAATFFTTINGAHRKGDFTYGYVVNLRYGITNIDGEESRKTDDRVATNHRISYILNEQNTMNAFAEVSFLTQFYNGYDYSTTPRSRISDFMAPGYFSEQIGYAYTPVDYISFEAGLGLKQTYVGDDALLPNYGVNPGDNLLSEGGLTAGISFKKEILPNVNYNTKLGTFSNLKKKFESTDVSWANELTSKINDYLTASFQLELLYDDDITTELQSKQVLSVGILVNLK